MNPRIALLGFSIECNRFAPPATLRDFEARCLLRGDAMVVDARAASPAALGEMPGFVTAMDAAGPWQPRPIMLAMAEPNGPVEQVVFDWDPLPGSVTPKACSRSSPAAMRGR